MKENKTGGQSEAFSTTKVSRSYKQIVGYASIGSASFLAICATVLSFVILFKLTAEPETLVKLRDSLIDEQIASRVSRNADNVDELNKSMALTFRSIIVLEYATADIRMTGIQVAVALVSGLLFVTLGLVLFSLGVAAPTDASGKFSSLQFRIATSSPGLIAIILGGVVIVAGVLKDPRQSMSAEIREATGVQIEEQSANLQKTTQGEGPATDVNRGH